jgi:hypothetical protein
VSAPLRGTQSLVGQMAWVFQRPLLTVMEVAWRWAFGLPFIAVCWMQARHILTVLPLDRAGLSALDAQNPWIAVVQLADAWDLYRPHVALVLRWLLPVAALAWSICSGLGRNLVLKRMEPRLRLRPLQMIALQCAWLLLLAAACWGWFRSVQWAATTHITPAGGPDLVGYSMWVIVFSLAFFMLWALVSWSLSVAPLLMLLEERSVLSALGQSLSLGKAFSSKLVEINLVMGIVKLALIVVAMVLAAAPLPFSDQLGAGAMQGVYVVASVFYLMANDYFHIVRLKSFVEFWHTFRGSPSGRDLMVAE